MHCERKWLISTLPAAFLDTFSAPGPTGVGVSGELNSALLVASMNFWMGEWSVNWGPALVANCAYLSTMCVIRFSSWQYSSNANWNNKGIQVHLNINDKLMEKSCLPKFKKEMTPFEKSRSGWVQRIWMNQRRGVYNPCLNDLTWYVFKYFWILKSHWIETSLFLNQNIDCKQRRPELTWK